MISSKLRFKSLLFASPIKKLLFLSGVYFALLNLFNYAHETLLGADIVSRVLPAMAPTLDIGIPYRDYWERTPPGHYIILVGWAKILGTSILSFKALHLLLMVVSIVLIYFIVRKILIGISLYLTCFLTFFILFSTRLITYIVPAELLALVFSLGGLTALFYIDNLKLRMFLSGFLLTFTGLIKDPFLFSLVLFIPVLIGIIIRKSESLFTGMLFLISGMVLAFGINFIYLMSLGNLEDYLAVVAQKSQTYGFSDIRLLLERTLVYLQKSKDIFFHFRYPLFIFFLFWVLLKVKLAGKRGFIKLFFNRKSKNLTFKLNLKFGMTEKSMNIITFIVYSIGGLLGFTAQGTIGSHYLIQMVFPIITILSLMGLSIYLDATNLITGLKYKKALKFFFAATLLALFIPGKVYFLDYNFTKFNPKRLVEAVLWAESNKANSKYEHIKSIVPKGSCIESVYGWGVGTTYFYSERRPCSKYFLAAFVNEKTKDEYKDSLIKSPPAVIVYTVSGAEVNTETFEKDYFNYPLVIKSCYTKDKMWSDVYAGSFTGDKQSECIKSAISAKI